jgi:pyruvate ferredoxin oxidoreductase gamma subunit
MFVYRQEVMAGLKESSSVIINHKQRPDIQKFKLFVVDATRIAMENGLVVAGWAVVNTAMLGAISKILGIVSKEALEKVVRKKWGGDLGERNLRATLQAFEEVS